MADIDLQVSIERLLADYGAEDGIPLQARHS